jgi:hypothetical protein
MTFKNRPRTYVLVAVAVLAALSLIGATTSASSVPRTSQVAALAPDAPEPLVITYQGRLVNPSTGEPKPDGTYFITFSLYSVESGGTALWSESQNVAVSKGLFSVTLGNQAGNAIDPGLFDGYGRWLGITIKPDATELSPRIRVASAPYAIWSNLAGNAANADRLGGSLPSAFAAAAHSHDAANIVSGNLSTNFYHAIDDLSAEGFLGNASGDVAVNNGQKQATLNADMLDGSHSTDFAAATHNHDAAYVNASGDSMNGTLSVIVPSGGSHGISSTTASTASGAAGVEGKNTGAGYGVQAGSAVNHGIHAWTSSTTAGIAGVFGWAGNKTNIPLNQELGVKGEAADGIGVAGTSNSSMGVYAYSKNSRAFEADGYDVGMYGYAFAPSPNSSYSVYGYNSSTSGYAGYFAGRVNVTGNFSVGGTKAFRIDHPLDPANEYLYHFAVESPEVRNLYQGNTVLDANGEAVVTLPDYFDALNADTEFNYQLTCIGGYADIYIAQEISGNQFKIAGGTSGLKVSWQVTAIRDDPYLHDYPVQAEVEKKGDEKGKYQYPEGYGQPESMAIANEQAQAPEPVASPYPDSAISADSVPADQPDQP